MGSLPNFYIEQGTSLPYRPDSQPIFTHALWQLDNVYPEINGVVNQSQYDGWSFTPSGLASGIVNTYFFWKNGLEAQGRTFEKYSFKISAIGVGRFNPSEGGVNPNSIWLMNNPGDQQIGSPATGNNGGNQEYISPWSTSGVHAMRVWGSGFWPLLKSLFDASGIPNPTIHAITSENGFDDTRGMIPTSVGRTGWVPRALADPRSNSVLFDGVQTFTDYWANTTGWYDGTPIPTGASEFGADGWQYAPGNQKLRHKHQAAYLNAHSYATRLGIMEPFEASFGSGIYTVEYTFFDSSTGFPVPYLYPDQNVCFYNLSHTAQGPDWYSTYKAFHNDLEDLVPPYWDSASGWYAIYPLPESSPWTQDEYAAIEYGVDYVTNALASAPHKPVIPWISTLGTSGMRPRMIEFLKRAYDNGVTSFYVYEGSGMSSQSEIDSWYLIIQEVNDYAFNSNPGISVSSDISNVWQFGNVYMRL